MPRSTRSETDVIADLKELAISPGYVHAIAEICYRENLVTYRHEIQASDLDKLYSRERLIRTEITTLLGFMVQGSMEASIPDPAVVKEYLERTDMLMQELHDAIGAPMSNNLLKAIEQKDPDLDNWSGEAMREPIFYGGESAYNFQYRDLAPEKYKKDDPWIMHNMGFSITQAKAIAECMSNLLVEKMTQVFVHSKESKVAPATWLPAFEVSPSELAIHTGMPAVVVTAFLNAFSMDTDNAQFESVGDFNGLAAKPLIATREGCVALFQSYSIYEAIYDSPFYWMMSDAAYKNIAAKHRGEFTEEFSARRLEHVFGRDHVLKNVNFVKGRAEVVCEADVLVIFGDRLIVLQAKSKKLTLEARRGNDGQLRKDFAGAIQDSYEQALLCAETILAADCRLIDSNEQEVVLPHAPKEIFLFNIVSDHYPALAFQSRQYLKVQEVEKIRAPFIMDVFLLDAMTEMLDTPLRLLSYAGHRVDNVDRLSVGQELTALGYHLKRNLWLEPEFDFVMLEDNIAMDLDVSMMVRRDNVPGPHTPEGILTRFSGTRFEKLLRQLEHDPSPFSIELSLMLMAMGEDSCRVIDQGLEHITRRTLADGKVHDFTVGGDDGGVTFHCNHKPSDEAMHRLGNYCECRKYTSHSPKWIGISLGTDVNLQFGLLVDSIWEQSDEMDQVTANMQKPMKPERLSHIIGKPSAGKVGRNDACPCGSGKKFKKCCL